MVNHGGITFIAEQVSFWSVYSFFVMMLLMEGEAFFFIYPPTSIQDYWILTGILQLSSC